MPRAFLVAWLVTAPTALLAVPTPASAFGHLWEISEIFSNADGTIQFIEMVSESTGENLLSRMFLRSAETAQEFHFPGDLIGDTANRRLLVATTAFAAQPGAVTPDFLMPDGFLRIEGDTLTFWSEALPGGIYGGTPPVRWDSFAFGVGGLPIDGIHSIHRDHGIVEIAPNSPINFAGQAGSLTVPEPASALLLGAGIAALGCARRRSTPDRPLPSQPRGTTTSTR